MSAVKEVSMRMQNRKGSVIVLVALLMVVLLGVGALAVDISQMQAYKSELQRTADAAALAAAMQLGHESNYSQADAFATRYIQDNPVMGDLATQVLLEYGRWNGSFTPVPCVANCGLHDNSFRVTVRSSGRFFLAQLLTGNPDFNVSAVATAWLPVNVTSCVAPWSVDKQAVWDAKYGSAIPSPTQLRSNPLGNQFVLKYNSNDSPPTPGYGAINLPVFPAVAQDPSDGKENYRVNIAAEPGDPHCRHPAIGDFVQRKSLPLDQETLDGLSLLCAGPLPGDCLNEGGQIGVGVRVPIVERRSGTACDAGAPDYVEDDFGTGKPDCAIITDIRTFVVIRTPSGPGERGRVLAVYAGTDENGPVRGYAQRPILVQ
jgi:Flp pilus assembly protein TadG